MTTGYYTEFGECVRRLTRSRKLSNLDIAESSGYSFGALLEYYRGDKPVDEDLVDKLTEAFADNDKPLDNLATAKLRKFIPKTETSTADVETEATLV